MSLAHQMAFPVGHPLAPTASTDLASVGELVPLLPSNSDRELPARPVLYTAATELDAQQLSQLVFDVRRRRPLVVITRTADKNKSPIADPEGLAAEAWPTADTVLTANEATLAFCALTPSWVHVFDGGIRIFLPGADLSDDDNTHPLITPDFGRGAVAKQAAKVMRTLRYATGKARHTNPFQVVDGSTGSSETKRQLERVTAELADARRKLDAAQLDEDPVFSDPVTQFDHELYVSWLRFVCEDDRADYPLRTYTLDDDFLTSIDELEGVARDRIMRACVDVVTKRYPVITSREAHRVSGERKGTGKGTPAIVRPSDGAYAMRAWITTAKVGARIMFWECPGDEVELARVATHNDLRLKY